MALSGSVPSLASWDAKIKKLCAACKARAEALKKREKKAAKKMFGGGGGKEKKEEKKKIASPARKAAPDSPMSPIPPRFEPKGELIPPPAEKIKEFGGEVKKVDVEKEKEKEKEGEEEGVDSERKEEEEVGFLAEHGEALLVLGVGAVAIALIAWLRKK